MNLIAQDFIVYPDDTPLSKTLRPLFAAANGFSFPIVIEEKNSNQFTFDFDQTLAKQLALHRAAPTTLSLPKEVRKELDFAFTYEGNIVAVEVEKSNSDKILYDFMKFHIYLSHGATAAVLILPRNWPHRSGEVNMFKNAVHRYNLCREHGFGAPAFFDKCLIVGYEQAMPDGRPLTRDLRRELIQLRLIP
ncbi:hypothetical protein [Brevifollis gellanilyticus]|uniref:Uncharacterized protein n=1 Tax=Brevifollis gellanilyticus TaxID=748831 RepID=A0A512MGL5_9BACT|nr:hypothetical protein [Brevifollis gellanilyticus]GEP45869.1 hypothetical protein BGE01nite_51600 [Brevifollis gellanilyticus]